MDILLPYSRTQFDQILVDHHRTIELINDLELRLYQMGQPPENSPGAECQRSAGVLIGHLRNVLFRWDQEVLPLIETLTTMPNND